MNVSRIIVTTERGAKYLIDFEARSFACIYGRSTVRVEHGPSTFHKVENVLIGGRMIVTWDPSVGEVTFIPSPIKAIEVAPEVESNAPTSRSSGRWCGIFPAVGSEVEAMILDFRKGS